MNYHSGLRFQRGRGLGALFGGLLRGFAPLARLGLNAGKRFIQSDMAKNIGSTLLDTGKKVVTNIAADLLEGNNVAESAQDELNEARRKIASTLRGSGSRRKRKKSCQKSICSSKKQKVAFNLLEDD
jgi:hypothetical protein